MEVEVKKEENPFIQPSVEEMIESSEVVSEPVQEIQEEPQKEEPTKGEAVKEDEKTVEKEEEPKGEESKKPNQLTDERFEELAKEFPELKEHRDSFNNYNTWEKKLRQKSQAIAYLKKLQEESPEKMELLVNKISPYMYGQEELPKAPEDLVDDIMKSVEVQDLKFVDDDEFEINIGKDKLEPVVRKAIEKALNFAVPELSALRGKLAELGKEKEEAVNNYKASMLRQGELEMEQLASKHTNLNLKRLEGESILQAVDRIQKAGDDHPEYHKLSKWNAIGNEAQKQGWTLEKAFNSLFGEEEKKILENNLKRSTASENQKGASQELPGGEESKEMEEWEELEIANSHEHAVDAMFKKHGL